MFSTKIGILKIRKTVITEINLSKNHSRFSERTKRDGSANLQSVARNASRASVIPH